MVAYWSFQGREAYLELDNVENDVTDENLNKEEDGYLQPSDVVPKKAPQKDDNEKPYVDIDEPHDYSEIHDVSNENGLIKDLSGVKEERSQVKMPSEYEMALKNPRYVNVPNDAETSRTTIL